MTAFFLDDAGQGLVEYGVMIAVVSVALIGGMALLSGQIGTMFSSVGNSIP